MGNFLVIVPDHCFRREAGRIFNSGLELAQRIKRRAPSRIVETEWVCAASFSRRNGSGTPIVIDEATGSWLLAIGTWFHEDGYGVGSERRLLDRYLLIETMRFTKELEGFFVIVIGDGRTRETVVVTDLIGSCHGFTRSLKHGIALSSSSLLLAGLEEFRLDPVGCQEFLYTGIIYEDRTVYKEVKKLGPASVFRFEDGLLKSQQRYWQITEVACESIEGKNAVTTLWERLVRSAQNVGRVFSRPVCDLTGGYDSRVVVSAFQMASVSFSTTVSGPESTPDVLVSRGLAKELGVPHLYIEPEEEPSFERAKNALAFTDGEYDIVGYSRILKIHQALSEHHDVSINGSFGEVARGYWWELLFPRTGAQSKLDAQRLARLRYAAGSFDPSLFPPELRLDLVAHFTGIIEQANAGLSHFPNTLQMDHAYLMMRMQRWQGRIASSTNQVWPCLSLFMLRSVLETILMIKANLRQRSLLSRRVMSDFEPRLGEFPLEHGFPALPVTWRNAYRFWPVFGYYGKRILAKASRRTGWKRSSATLVPGNLPPRLKLWREEEVQKLLDPGEMKLGRVADRKALGSFLSNSKRQDFPFDGQWASMLSLECALDVLEQVKNVDHQQYIDRY